MIKEKKKEKFKENAAWAAFAQRHRLLHSLWSRAKTQSRPAQPRFLPQFQTHRSAKSRMRLSLKAKVRLQRQMLLCQRKRRRLLQILPQTPLLRLQTVWFSYFFLFILMMMFFLFIMLLCFLLVTFLPSFLPSFFPFVIVEFSSVIES